MSPKRELQRFFQHLILKFRWRQAPRSEPEGLDVAYGLERCDITYINLDHRTDRREQVKKEFSKIGAKNIKRFSAHKHKRGSIGCAMSHLDILRSNLPSLGRVLMVCEDDLEFLVDRARLDKLIESFYRDSRMDVLCLAYNRRNGISVDEDFLISSNSRTTACYIAKPHALHAIEACALKSIKMLEDNIPDKSAAIDVVWREAQRKHIFALAKPRAARQYSSYSDIEGRIVDYKV